MKHTEAEKIIEKLINKTKNNQTIWQAGTSATEFVLDFGKGSVTIDVWKTNSDRDIGEFVLYNSDGAIISKDKVYKDEYPNVYEQIQKLHSLIHVKHYKLDETIASLFSQLDSDEKMGKEPPKPIPDDDIPF